jgi:hypothetical protein
MSHATLLPSNRIVISTEGGTSCRRSGETPAFVCAVALAVALAVAFAFVVALAFTHN